MKRRHFVVLIGLLALSNPLQAQETATRNSETPAAEVPATKRTTPGLYVTSKQAYAKWQANSKNVKIVDVRTPEEYAFVGHAEMAWNIPLMLVTHNWTSDRSRMAMKPNPEFLEQMKKISKPTDTLLVMCRSGARSKIAVDLLVKEGFEGVYQVFDGFEGDSVKDPENVFVGQRLKNGWRNSGLPWTYKLNADIVRLPESP